MWDQMPNLKTKTTSKGVHLETITNLAIILIMNTWINLKKVTTPCLQLIDTPNHFFHHAHLNQFKEGIDELKKKVTTPCLQAFDTTCHCFHHEHLNQLHEGLDELREGHNSLSTNNWHTWPLFSSWTLESTSWRPSWT